MKDETEYLSKLGGYAEELENGIMNLVVTLCQQKALKIPLPKAKEEVADYLESLATSLREIEE